MRTFKRRSRHIVKLTLSRVLYHTGLFRLFCLLCRRREINFLVYHKTGRTDDPIGLNVRPDVLERQIAALMPYTRFISLDQAVEMIRSREIDRHYTVLTFDDGYQSNHQFAYPILTKYGVPGTIYLNVGAIEAGQLYLEIINAVLLNENNTRVIFGNGDKSEMVFDLTDPAARLRAIYDSHYFLKSWRKEEIEGLISRLRQNYSVDELQFDPVLSWDDAEKMNSNLISFGSHGLSHVILTKMNPSEWVDEIVGSRQIIENRLGRKISSFAYPNGEAQDFNDSIVALIKQAGYTSAATAIPGAVGAEGADLFRLPRVDVTERISLDAYGRFSQALFLCKVFRIL